MEIRVILHDPSGKQGPALLPDNVPMQRLIPALVDKLDLPEVDLEDDSLLVYSLYRLPSGELIPQEMTLAQANIQNGGAVSLEMYDTGRDVYAGIETVFWLRQRLSASWSGFVVRFYLWRNAIGERLNHWIFEMPYVLALFLPIVAGLLMYGFNYIATHTAEEPELTAVSTPAPVATPTFTATPLPSPLVITPTITITTSTPISLSKEYDVQPISGLIEPEDLTEMNGVLFLTAVNSTGQRNLWRIDGLQVQAITTDLLDVGGLTPINDQLYFIGSDVAHGTELWISDGTSEGTHLVRDIQPGEADAYVGGLTEFKGQLYFRANNGQLGSELWRSDGTEAGTKIVSDINSVGSSQPQSLTAVNDLLFFSAIIENGHRELWATNGNHTYMVKEVSDRNGYQMPAQLTKAGDQLFFVIGVTPTSAGQSLWRSDGTEAGTVQIHFDDLAAYERPTQLTAVNDWLCFTDQPKLWCIQDSSLQLVSSKLNPHNLFATDQLLFFVGNDGAHGDELWRSTVAITGTFLIKDIHQRGTSFPLLHTFADGRLYFTATDGVNGRQLWVTDGEKDNATILNHPALGNDDLRVLEMIAVQNQIYFVESGGAGNSQLWQLVWQP